MDKLIKEYEDLSNREFMVQMADHLDSSDYRFLNEVHQRKMQIRKELKELYNYEV